MQIVEVDIHGFNACYEANITNPQNQTRTNQENTICDSGNQTMIINNILNKKINFKRGFELLS